MSRLNIRHPGKAWAYTATVVGLVMSIAANVASRLPSLPVWLAQATAGMWPAFLFIGFEVLVRVEWVRSHQWAGWIGMSAVVSVPAIVSYNHMFALLERMGESHPVCILGPLAVDGLVLMGSMAIWSMAKRTREARAAAPYSPALPLRSDELTQRMPTANGFGHR